MVRFSHATPETHEGDCFTQRSWGNVRCSQVENDVLVRPGGPSQVWDGPSGEYGGITTSNPKAESDACDAKRMDQNSVKYFTSYSDNPAESDTLNRIR